MNTFKCKQGCNAECCGMIPLPINLWKKELTTDEQLFAKKHAKQIIKSKEFVVLIPKTRECVFLKKNKRCKIYSKRPQICMDYGTTQELPCPYIDTDGSPRTNTEIEKTRALINHRINKYTNEKYQI